MSLAINPKGMERRQLLPAVQIQRKVAGSPSEREKIYSGDNDLALRNDHAVLFAAVDEACDPISKIAPNIGSDVVGKTVDEYLLNGKNIHQRIVSHVCSPPEARENHTATSCAVPDIYFHSKTTFCVAALKVPLTGTGAAEAAS